MRAPGGTTRPLAPNRSRRKPYGDHGERPRGLARRPTIDVRIALQNLRIALPHIGLVILSAAYTIMGAAIFHHFEKPYELEIRNETSFRVFNLKQSIIDELWNLSHRTDIDEDLFSEIAHQKSATFIVLTVVLRKMIKV